MKKYARRLIVLLLAVLMLNAMTLNAYAASANVKQKAGVSTSYVTISTPYQYRWFWQSRKTISVTVKNTGSQLLTLNMSPKNGGCEYKVFKTMTVAPGETKQVYVLPHDSCDYKMSVSSSTVSYNRSFTVTTSGGSISVP